ncbi:MAG: family 20 glycosylhydrolase [Chitinivibrionales bacterium]|nr:family 20 glycosylhydrolase [Chitinivibrionales bacterium]
MVFPHPAKARYSRKKTDITGVTGIRLDSCFSLRCKATAESFAEDSVKFFAKKLVVLPLDSRANHRNISCVLTPSIGKKEWYKINVTDDDITIEASDEAGAFYGFQTLQQVVCTFGSAVPLCTIEDHPDFQNRGVMLDISRCKVPTMATLKQAIDLFASLRINQLQLYTEHTFAFTGHETVWKDASPLTAGEVRELDQYCRDRFIEFVPNFNSFGHFERWLSHPEYKHLAESPYGFEHPLGGRSDYGSTLKPNRATLQFLDLLYGEFLPNFTSRQFNVGCDETWELGTGWSRKSCEKKGTTRVYLEFLKKIHKLVKKYGHRMMFWGDIILKEPALIPELPQDLIALCWGYEGNHPFNREGARFSNAGLDFYVCPGTSSWNSLTGRTANCLKNCANAARNGKKHGASGYLITDWGDHGHHQYWPISFIGLFAGAAYSWCYRSNAKADIVAAVNEIKVRDTTGRTGKLLYDLGSVLELLPVRMRNKTVFNTLLFAKPGDLEAILRRISKGDLKKSIRKFDTLEKKIPSIKPEIPDASLIRQELTNAIRMARFGAKRGLIALGEPADTKELRRELKNIIAQHKKLWLKRNRPGGLEESAGKLEKVLEYLN